MVGLVPGPQLPSPDLFLHIGLPRLAKVLGFSLVGYS